MRETRFRGKRIDNGEWVEGYLSKARLLGYMDNALQPAIDREAVGVMISSVVDPDTVGQGVCIDGEWYYEGDIFWCDDNKKHYVLIFDRSGFALECEYGTISVDFFYWMKKVGNVWDNPDLVGWYNAQTKDGDENGI